MADKYLCRICSKTVTATAKGRYRSHTTADGELCGNAGLPVPEGMPPEDGPADVPKEGVDFATCPQCERKVKLTRLGYFEPHNETLMGGDRCPTSGVRAKHARKTSDVLLPGDEPASPVPKVKDSSTPAANRGLALPAGSGASTEESSPESTTTSTASRPDTTPSPTEVFSLGVSFSDRFLQPFSPFLQPEAYEGPVKAEPMGDLAKELATKIKETFYAYSNRKSTDNRSAQTTLGPSEIGTPCDRRLAMALMGIQPVNPGGDGWAAFVGTCTHEGMANIYTFADAGTGRYAVELPVFTGTPSVPRGTTDLLDRRDGTVVDWKVMGAYSLKKFKAEGPSSTYRTQAHVYGLGAERAGEKVRNVAIVGLPRAGSSLDEMHVWTEKYDRKFAQDALDRVEKIAASLVECGPGLKAGSFDEMSVAKTFEVGDDCRYCPFHMKNDKEMTRGCPGK